MCSNNNQPFDHCIPPKKFQEKQGEEKTSWDPAGKLQAYAEALSKYEEQQKAAEAEREAGSTSDVGMSPTSGPEKGTESLSTGMGRISGWMQMCG